MLPIAVGVALEPETRLWHDGFLATIGGGASMWGMEQRMYAVHIYSNNIILETVILVPQCFFVSKDAF